MRSARSSKEQGRQNAGGASEKRARFDGAVRSFTYSTRGGANFCQTQKRRSRPPKVPEKPVGIEMREAANDQFRKGEYREALAAYDRAASQLDGAEAAKCHANKAEAYLRLKEYQSAAESASKALELDESNVKARYRRGKAALELGDAAAALEDLGQAAKSGDKASSELFRKALEQQRRAVFNQAVEEETGPYDLEVLVDAYRVGSDDPEGLSRSSRRRRGRFIIKRRRFRGGRRSHRLLHTNLRRERRPVPDAA